MSYRSVMTALYEARATRQKSEQQSIVNHPLLTDFRNGIKEIQALEGNPSQVYKTDIGRAVATRLRSSI